MARVTFTYVTDATRPGLNIRVATDASGYDMEANRAAVARYFGAPLSHIEGSEVEGIVVFHYPNMQLLAYVRHDTVDIEYDVPAH